MNLWKRMKLAGRVLTRGAEGTDMPEGVKPPARRSDTEPLQLSTVFRGVQVLQTAITGLPVVEQRGGRDLPDVSPLVLQPDVSRSRRDFIADIVASLVLDGNAFTRIVRDWQGEIVTCEVLPPQYVTVTDESDDPARPDLRFSYLGRDLHDGGHRAQQVPQRARTSSRPRPHLGGARGNRGRAARARLQDEVLHRWLEPQGLSAHERERHEGDRAAGEGSVEERRHRR